jgi:sugar phosphate isomerase/epimerase
MDRIAASVSISPLTTPGWALEDDLALYRELDLGRASVSMTKLSHAGGVARAARMVADAGVAVDVVYPAGGLDLSRPEQWPEARHSMLAAVGVARLTGAAGVLVAGGGAHGLAFEDAVERFCDAVGPVAASARSDGVRLLLEPVRPQFAYAGFVHTFRDAVPVARRLGLGVVFDVTHCWWEPELDTLLRGHVDLIGAVHLADLALDGPVVHRLVPGDGELPLPRLVSLLLAAGYAGPFELELIGPAIDAEGYRGAAARGAAYTRALLAELSPPP